MLDPTWTGDILLVCSVGMALPYLHLGSSLLGERVRELSETPQENPSEHLKFGDSSCPFCFTQPIRPNAGPIPLQSHLHYPLLIV